MLLYNLANFNVTILILTFETVPKRLPEMQKNYHLILTHTIQADVTIQLNAYVCIKDYISLISYKVSPIEMVLP